MTDSEAIVFTLKHGKGYDDSWAVFRGDAQTIRKNAMEFYGVTEDQVTGLDPAEVLEAIRLSVQGSGLNTTPTQAPKEKPEGIPQVETDKTLLQRVESAATVADIDALWVANKDAFNDSKVIAAAKKRKAEIEKESN